MAEVINNLRIGNNYFKMEIMAPQIAEKARAGQFLHLKVRKEWGYDPLLRRPLSIHDLKKEEGIIVLIYRVVGRGTENLSYYKKGDKINILGPLGQGFQLDKIKQDILIIGGGMGVAPLYYPAKELCSKMKKKVLFLAGGRNRDDLKYFQPLLSELDLEFGIATDDGSFGYKGTVTELWGERYGSYHPEYIFTCGPEPMLREIQKKAGEMNIPGEVLLEERMGCGIGLCLSCVCRTRDGNKRVCKEGPVLSLDEVIFDD